MLNIQGNAIVQLIDTLVGLSEPPTEEEAATLKTIGEEILSVGLEFNYPEINVETQWGNVHYSQRMVFPPLELENGLFPNAFAKNLYYQGNFELDENFVNFLVDQVLKNQMGANLENLDDETQKNLRAATLGQLLLAKYLVKNEDGTFTAKFAFENGIFTLNGNPMDLMQALGQTS